MSNETVIKLFLEGLEGKTPLRSIYNENGNYKGRTLQTDGRVLINYSTVIAYWHDGNLYLNTEKYSSTTSHIQSKLRRLAEANAYKIIDFTGEV